MKYLQERDQVDNHLLVPEWQRGYDLGDGVLVLRTLDALLVHVVGNHGFGQVTDPQSEERARDVRIGNACDVVVAQLYPSTLLFVCFVCLW